MIPILYTSDETRFITNGIGRLSDCTRCIVTEERNGIYECEFDYPLTGVHFEEIQMGRIIGCTHDDKHDIQPFVIYSRTVPDLNGIVTFNAHHISYALNEVVVMPFTATSVTDAMSKLKTKSVNTNPFTFWTDKTTVGDFNVTVPKAIRGLLAGEEGSLLDIYGAGDYEFDKFTVKLHAHRGLDSDVEIRYSKNLIDLNETIDAGSEYDAIVPYWADSEGNLVMLPEVVLVYSGLQPRLAYLTDHNLIIIRTETDEPIEVPYYEIHAVPYDMSSDFQEKPSVTALRNAARNKFENSNAWLPKENLTIDFVQLWQTEEFKEYTAAQRVSLCDTVSVYYPAAGIVKVKQQVIKVVYNVLLDRYDSIELGQLRNSLGQTIRSEILQEVPTTSMMDAAIQYATDMIRGGLGGYVVMTPGPDGYPQEILIMDTPDVATAVNVWRFNQGGLGHSHSGYEGPFDDVALTQDGRINATMITTGLLDANLIRAGVITDTGGRNSWNLDTGQFITTQGRIGAFDISTNALSHTQFGEVDFLLNSGGLTLTASSTETELTKYAFNLRYYDENDNQKLGALLHTAAGLRLYTADVSSGSYPAEILLSFDPSATYPVEITGDVYINGSLVVGGTKPRRVQTKNYADRLLYCYETPTPLFGDIGGARLDEDGICYVDLDDIFAETIASKVEYQVFLQKEGEGDCYIAEKQERYFVIKGTPDLKVAWEIKAKQRDYEAIRLEQAENGLDEYRIMDDKNIMRNNEKDYVSKQEELLYG